MGKSSINGPFSMAMLNYQRVMLQLTRFCGSMERNVVLRSCSQLDVNILDTLQTS